MIMALPEMAQHLPQRGHAAGKLSGVFLQHGLEVFDLALQGNAGQPEKEDAGMGERGGGGRGGTEAGEDRGAPGQWARATECARDAAPIIGASTRRLNG